MAKRQSDLESESAQALNAIDADLERNARSLGTYLDVERCVPRRRALLQEAAALPIEAHADAVSKLRIALRHGSSTPRTEWGDARSYFSGMGPVEDRPIFELCLQVFEWLERQADNLPQIRAALLAALQHYSGDLEEGEEPGLSDSVRGLEAQLRAAIALLDGRGGSMTAAKLKALAPVQPPVGTVTLSAEAAVQVRAAMLEVLALHDQRLLEECEPGLDEHTREVARAMRRAMLLLDGATARAAA